MYVVNPQFLNKCNLFYCEDEDLQKKLMGKGFMYLSKKYNNKSTVLIFYKTKELNDELQKL